MKLLEKLRYYSFWGVDFLKGGKVRSHYRDVRFILDNYSTDKSQGKRDLYLQKLLKHAVNTTPFYNEYKNYNSLSDFPVVDKVFIRQQFDNFVSKEYKGKPSFEVYTSGSTGTPFTVYLDKNKKYRNTADTIYFGKKAGYELGQKLFYIRDWNNVPSKSKLFSLIQNIRKVNVKHLDDVAISKLVEDIKTGNSSNAMLGYTSAFKEICKYLDSINSKPIKVNITSMIANAEALGDYTKKSIKKYFDFDILSRYSNMENGILSQQIINGGNFFHINWASFYIEILNMENDSPVNYGEQGRVVVTDLFNFHLPMIRYDTGDIAVMDVDKACFNGAPSFFKVDGRKMDTIYDTRGRIMTTVVYELEHFPEFKQFQLIQENENTYIVNLNLDKAFRHETKMVRMLKNYLGEDSIIKIIYVDEIPQLSSGKRKLTINKFRV